ncbi:MAG: acyltransferase [Bacteroidales bacterium]|nr:acyltransferase [Bacteroidales bacterium]
MKHKLLLIYSWLIRTLLFFLPDIPFIMRFRGWLYGLGMLHKGKNFQLAHSTILNTIEMISVGENVYIANFCSIIANGNITIGDNTLFGPGVVISSGNHRFEDGLFIKQSDKKDVAIGKNSWVAANCTIVGGSVLPESSILAANSVLTSKLDETLAGCLYGGTPAKFIKKL